MKLLPSAFSRSKFTDFSGRASRAEYLHGTGALFLVYFSLVLLAYGFDAGVRFLHIDYITVPPEVLANTRTPFRFITFVLIGATFLPILSLHVRRLHDLGLTGWLCLAYFTLRYLLDPDPLGRDPEDTLLEYISGFLYLLLSAVPSRAGSNKYGPHPYEKSTHPIISAAGGTRL